MTQAEAALTAAQNYLEKTVEMLLPSWMALHWENLGPCDERRVDLSREGDDGYRIHVRVGDARHEVGGAGAGGGHADPRLPGHAGVAVSRVGRGLLVADEDMPYLRVLRQRIVERQQHPAGEAEHDVHSLGDETFTQYLGAGLFHTSPLTS